MDPGATSLSDAVVLPRMSATVPLESEDARSAVQAARAGEMLVLLLPKVDGRYATVGAIAKVDEKGNLPDGTEVAVIQARHRGVLGAVSPDLAGVLWAEVEPHPDPKEVSDRARQLAGEYRAVVENILELRGASQIAQILRGIQPGARFAVVPGAGHWVQFEPAERFHELLTEFATG